MNSDLLCCVFYASFIACLAAVIALCSAFAKKKGEAWLRRVIKIATVSYLTLSMVDVFLPDLFMCAHELDALASMGDTTFHAILRWLNLVSFAVLPIACFQENKYFEKIASFFCLPISLLNVAFFFQYIDYFTASSNSGLQTMRILGDGFKSFLVNDAFRAVFFGLTCLCQIVALALLTYKNRAKLALAKNFLPPATADVI